MADSQAILKDYESALEDLTFNSKPIINMLTMEADKHSQLAPDLVQVVKARFFKVVDTFLEFDRLFFSSLLSVLLNSIVYVYNNADYNKMYVGLKILFILLAKFKLFVFKIGPCLMEVSLPAVLGASRMETTHHLSNGLHDKEPWGSLPGRTYKRNSGRVLPRLRNDGTF